MRKVMFWSPCIYLFICMRVTQKVLNRIAGNLVVMIGYYPGTIWLDFGIDRVKSQGQCHEKVRHFLNRMTFGGMIGYYPGTIWLDFGINWVKVMKRSKSSFCGTFLSNWHATNAKMFIIQCPILWYAKVCAPPSAHSSSSSAFLDTQRTLHIPKRTRIDFHLQHKWSCYFMRCLSLTVRLEL